MTLTASPETDLQVATACGMNHAEIHESERGRWVTAIEHGPPLKTHWYFRPSTDLNDSFLAAEKFGFVNFRLEKCSLNRNLRTYMVLAIVREEHEILGQEDTPALALCAAILKLAETK